MQFGDASIVLTPSFRKTTHRFIVPIRRRNSSTIEGFTSTSAEPMRRLDSLQQRLPVEVQAELAPLELDPKKSFACSFTQHLRNTAIRELNHSFHPLSDRKGSIPRDYFVDQKKQRFSNKAMAYKTLQLLYKTILDGGFSSQKKEPFELKASQSPITCRFNREVKKIPLRSLRRRPKQPEVKPLEVKLVSAKPPKSHFQPWETKILPWESPPNEWGNPQI